MNTILPWLPTLIAALTAALALGGSRAKLDAIEGLLKDVRSEGAELAKSVHEVLTAKAVTAAELAALRAENASLRTENDRRREEVTALGAELRATVEKIRGELAALASSERDLRHKHAEQVNTAIREIEAVLRERHS